MLDERSLSSESQVAEIIDSEFVHIYSTTQRIFRLPHDVETLVGPSEILSVRVVEESTSIWVKKIPNSN